MCAKRSAKGYQNGITHDTQLSLTDEKKLHLGRVGEKASKAGYLGHKTSVATSTMVREQVCLCPHAARLA